MAGPTGPTGATGAVGPTGPAGPGGGGGSNEFVRKVGDTMTGDLVMDYDNVGPRPLVRFEDTGITAQLGISDVFSDSFDIYSNKNITVSAGDASGDGRGLIEIAGWHYIDLVPRADLNDPQFGVRDGFSGPLMFWVDKSVGVQAGQRGTQSPPPFGAQPWGGRVLDTRDPLYLGANEFLGYPKDLNQYEAIGSYRIPNVTTWTNVPLWGPVAPPGGTMALLEVVDAGTALGKPGTTGLHQRLFCYGDGSVWMRRRAATTWSPWLRTDGVQFGSMLGNPNLDDIRWQGSFVLYPVGSMTGVPSDWTAAPNSTALLEVDTSWQPWVLNGIGPLSPTRQRLMNSWGDEWQRLDPAGLGWEPWVRIGAAPPAPGNTEVYRNYQQSTNTISATAWAALPTPLTLTIPRQPVGTMIEVSIHAWLNAHSAAGDVRAAIEASGGVVNSAGTPIGNTLYKQSAGNSTDLPQTIQSGMSLAFEVTDATQDITLQMKAQQQGGGTRQVNYPGMTAKVYRPAQAGLNGVSTGTFTPEFRSANLSTAVASSAGAANWMRVGQRVYVEGSATITNNASDLALVLPFPSASADGLLTVAVTGFISGTNPTGGLENFDAFMRTYTNESRAVLMVGSGGWRGVAGTKIIRFNGWYTIQDGF